MYRIDNSTAATTLPAPAAVGPNPNGYFTDGDPATSTPATVVDDDWANAVQEEICTAVTDAGLTLSKTNRGQLAQAIPMLIPHQGRTGVASSGSITIPAGVYYFHFDDAIGGGGGGGGSYGSGSGGSGGAGSPSVSGGFPVEPGDVIDFTIGAAGGGGGAADPASQGGSGGTTTITKNGTLMVSVTGGVGGLPGTNGLATSTTSPGAVTTASGVVSEILPGVAGGLSYNLGSGTVVSAVGGSSGVCGYSAQSVGSTSQNGQSAANYGGGGGAGIIGGSGGNGGAGFAAYWW